MQSGQKTGAEHTKFTWPSRGVPEKEKAACAAFSVTGRMT